MTGRSLSGRPIDAAAMASIAPPAYIRQDGSWIFPTQETVRDYPLRLIDGMPADQYVNQIKPMILDAVDYRAFDTRIIIAGTNLTAGTYPFFAVAMNGSENSLDGGTTFAKKTVEYTNMIEAGKIEGGNTLIVDSVQVSILVPHRDYNAFTTATGLPSTGAPSATDTNSATNCLGALLQGTYLTFTEPNHGNFAEGKLQDFPSDRVVGAAFGGSTPEGFVQIGMGVPQYLRYVRVLQSLHNFNVNLQAFRTITFPLNMIIEVALCGIKLLG